MLVLFDIFRNKVPLPLPNDSTPRFQLATDFFISTVCLFGRWEKSVLEHLMWLNSTALDFKVLLGYPDKHDKCSCC